MDVYKMFKDMGSYSRLEKREAEEKAALANAAAALLKKKEDADKKAAKEQATKEQAAAKAEAEKLKKQAKVDADIAEQKVKELNKLIELKGDSLIRAQAIPISGQWITFPYPMRLFKLISWQDGILSMSANYYYCKCYYGVLSKEDEKRAQEAKEKTAQPVKQPSNPYVTRYPTAYVNAPIQVLGQTTIFVCQEYADLDTRGYPLDKFHLADLAGVRSSTDPPKWLTMKLDDCVHYGSSGIDSKGKVLRRFTGYHRWVVYHPPAGPLIPAPNMYQHRFTEIQATVTSAMQQIPAYFDVTIPGGAGGAAALSQLIKLAFAAIGHELHPFLDEQGMKEATQLLTVNDAYITAKAEEYIKRRAAILTIERHRMDLMNAETDEAAIQHINLVTKELEAEQLTAPDQENAAALEAATNLARTAIQTAKSRPMDGDNLLSQLIDEDEVEELPAYEATPGSGYPSAAPLVASIRKGTSTAAAPDAAPTAKTTTGESEKPKPRTNVLQNNLREALGYDTLKKMGDKSQSADPLTRNTMVLLK